MYTSMRSFEVYAHAGIQALVSSCAWFGWGEDENVILMFMGGHHESWDQTMVYKIMLSAV